MVFPSSWENHGRRAYLRSSAPGQKNSGEQTGGGEVSTSATSKDRRVFCFDSTKKERKDQYHDWQQTERRNSPGPRGHTSGNPRTLSHIGDENGTEEPKRRGSKPQKYTSKPSNPGHCCAIHGKQQNQRREEVVQNLVRAWESWKEKKKME